MNGKLIQIWNNSWKPPERKPVWQWAEENIRSIPYSPMPGRFRVENSPMIRDVMEAIVDPRIRLVSIIASVQSGKTTAPEIALCYIIRNLPGPAIWFNQTDDDAKDQSENRLQPLFDECTPVKELFHKNPNKKRNNTIVFANGMRLWIKGAHNRNNLQSRSIRWIIGDETWRWPQGHMAEAEARVTAFGWLGKCIFMSQGGEDNDDTHRKFESTDMREWEYSCPECQTRQPYLWSNIEWPSECKDENGQYDYNRIRRSTWMKCPYCDHQILDTDNNRKKLNATAIWVRQNSNAPEENVGFHWNALSTMSWGHLAEMYLRGKSAARQGDLSLLKAFYQKRLGLPWKEYDEDFKLDLPKSGFKMGDIWEKEAGITERGRICLPEEEKKYPLRMMTVDVQMDHFFILVRSWAIDGSSRLLHCCKGLSWEDIDETRNTYQVNQSLVFIDAGHATYDVYKHCSQYGWTALMGDRKETFSHKTRKGKIIQRFYSPCRKVNGGGGRVCRMHYWSNLNIKDSLAALRKNQDPTQGATWEVPMDAPDDYIAMMESEIKKKVHGKSMWVQIGRRPNHYFDCEAMQICAATMLKLIGSESVD